MAVRDRPQRGARRAAPAQPASSTAEPLDDRAPSPPTRSSSLRPRDRSAALATLAPRDREVIALKFHAGLSNAELARVLGVSESNAGHAAPPRHAATEEGLPCDGVTRPRCRTTSSASSRRSTPRSPVSRSSPSSAELAELVVTCATSARGPTRGLLVARLDARAARRIFRAVARRPPRDVSPAAGARALPGAARWSARGASPRAGLALRLCSSRSSVSLSVSRDGGAPLNRDARRPPAADERSPGVARRRGCRSRGADRRGYGRPARAGVQRMRGRRAVEATTVARRCRRRVDAERLRVWPPAERARRR